jgi:methionyl-tRNA synthetase
LLDQKYLQAWDFQWYLQEWYALVQSANGFITRAEPRKKYKDEATKQEALDDLAFLLYIVKNLALLSAPILVNGFAKIQNILGNQTLSAIDSSKDYVVWSTAFTEAFAMKEFTVNLKPEIIYQRKEKAE